MEGSNGYNNSTKVDDEDQSDSLNITSSQEEEEEQQQPLHSFEVESPDSGVVRRSFSIDQQFHSMDAMEILRESIRILRYDNTCFMVIAAILICPVSAVDLSKCFVQQSLVKKLSTRILLVVNSSGIPLMPFVKQLCDALAATALSTAFSLPFYLTLSLLAKGATVYTVDCIYSRKHFDLWKFSGGVIKTWRRLASTYLWACMVNFGCIALFLILLVSVYNVFSLLRFPFHLIIYPLAVVGLVFTVIFANAIIICNLAVTTSVLEDVSGLKALLRSRDLIMRQLQVGLLVLVGTAIGMAFVEGLFDHRVKTVSYGDGSSRLWEGPLLVIMYSFVVLIDYIMSAIFYFTCKSSCMETLEEEEQNFVETSIPSG